ncbi:MAG: type 4a pilus biogenesis protein PilO [Elusimicrobiota bacterium]
MKKFSKDQIQQIAIGALFAFLFVFVYWRYFLKPTTAAIKEKKIKIEEMSKRVEELDRRAKRLDRLKTELAAAEQDWQGLRARLPDKRDLPGIINTITQITHKHRLTLSTISPMQSRGSDLYNEYPFNITITGTYHDIAQFLVSVGNLDRIYRAENLSLTPAAPTPEAPNVSVGASLTLITYQYKGS